MVYRCPNIGQEENVKLQNAREVSKGNVLGVTTISLYFLIQDCFLTQHVLEPTKGGNVLDLMLYSQNELVDNVKVHEPDPF